MQQAGTRLSDPAPKWYRGAFRDDKENVEEHARGNSEMIRPRRSLLFMPGSNARALEKGRVLPADGLILDLEDSVAPDAKGTAREQIAKAVAADGYGGREL